MVSSSVLAVGILMKLVMVIFIIVCLALVLIILIQKGRGGGLSGVLGGGAASGIMGSKTGDFLTWVTIGLVAVFLVLSVIMAKGYKPKDAGAFLSPTTNTQPVDTEPTDQTMPDESTDAMPTGEDVNLGAVTE